MRWIQRWIGPIDTQNLLTMRAVQASIAVVVITLVLFFASGMYEEKIRYAHRCVRHPGTPFRKLMLTRSYITHSNKALRPLNMHLNLRRPPATFPIPFFRSKVTIPTPPPPVAIKPLPNRRQSTTSTVMASIPPSHNPRGELIFSSRVDKTFREGYERYRAAFERRREEKAREEARRNARWFSGVGASRTPTTSTPTPPASRRGTPPPSLGASGGEKALGEMRRGRTPSPGMTAGSRLRHSVDLGNLVGPGNGTTTGTAGGTGNGNGSGSANGSGKEGRPDIKRERAESYSFVWSDGGPKRAP